MSSACLTSMSFSTRWAKRSSSSHQESLLFHRGPPSHQGLIMVFDEDPGTPLAVMDATYITAIRTGGTAAVATRLLARDDASVLAILGAGVQGGSHLETFTRIRDFKEIRVASRDSEKAKALA